MCLQRSQIRGVFGAVRKGDVQVARLLAERKVRRAVQRHRIDAGVVPEDRGRAVPLVHVAVDNRAARGESVTLQHAGRDGHVVEHAVSGTVVGERVVGTASQIGRDAGVPDQYLARGGNGRADGSS